MSSNQAPINYAELLSEAGIETAPAGAPGWTPRPRVSPEDSAGDNSRGVGDFFSTAIKQDWAAYGLARIAADSGLEVNADFRLADIPEEEWKELTAGIPEEMWEGLSGAMSHSHAYILADRIRESMATEERLAEYGGWGIAGRVGLAIADPAAILLAMGTGGVGVLSKGERLVNAARTARAAGNVAGARKAVTALGTAAGAGTTGTALRIGALAGVENAALESVIIAGDPTRDGWDVATAGLGGLVLGAGVGKLLSGREKRMLQTAYQKERKLLELAELDETLKARRGDILAKLDGNPDEIRSALDALDADAVRLKETLGEQFDTLTPDVIQARLAEIEQYTGARLDELRLAAADAPKRTELRDLRKEVKRLRREAAKLEGDEARVEARMLAEDRTAMGPEVAATKQRAKLRRKAAQKEVGTRRREIESRLARASSQQERLTAADIARTELRRVERMNKDGKLEREAQTLREALDLGTRKAGLEPKRGLLRDLDNLDNLRNDADNAASNINSGTGPQGFSEDTLSAARAIGVVDDITEMLKLPSDSMPAQGKMQFAAATTLIGRTFSGVLRGSSSERVRSTLGRIVGNSVGNEDDSVVAVGASEVAARLHETMQARFYSAVTPAYREWAERQGHGLLARQTRKVREEFMQQVGLATRGELTEVDPAVQKVVDRQGEVYRDFLRQAQEAGVKGFENVDVNERYLPRVFDFRALAEIEKDVGTEGINQLVIGAIRSANEDMPEELAEKLGRAYVKRLRQLRVGSDAHVLQGVRWDDVGYLRQFLTDSGMDGPDIDKVVNDFAALNAQRSRQQEGSFRYAKRRTQLDETFAVKLRTVDPTTGEFGLREVRMSDLLENNAESLFQRYARSVSGHIGLAKVGIRSRGDFEAMLREAENELAHDLDELERVQKHAEMAYKIVTGSPVEDSTALTRAMRTARDWNFATTMNQAGFAQVPDIAALISKGYLRYTLGNLGFAIRAMKRSDGTLDDAFARELEEWTGVGTDYHNNAIFSAYDADAGHFDSSVSSVAHTARVLGRGTQAASGMAFITAMTQRLAARVIVQRITDDVLKGGTLNARHRADLGLDEAMSGRIADQLKKHSQFLDNEAEGQVRIVNWAAWDDVEARDAMLNAVFRESRRIVQEEDLGDTTRWMHRTWGKVLAQFRRFALVSYSKQVLHGISHRDAETGTRLLVSMGLAALAYRARWELRLAQMEAAGVDRDKIEEMRERYLSPEQQAAAAFANSTYSTLLPGVIDTVAYHAADKRLFDTRTSQQASDFFEGVPTIALAQNTLNTAKAVWESAARGDRQFTKSDAAALRRLVPWQNALGIDYAFGAVTADLPERDEDDDPDRQDWFFN